MLHPPTFSIIMMVAGQGGGGQLGNVSYQHPWASLLLGIPENSYLEAASLPGWVESYSFSGVDNRIAGF